MEEFNESHISHHKTNKLRERERRYSKNCKKVQFFPEEECNQKRKSCKRCKHKKNYGEASDNTSLLSSNKSHGSFKSNPTKKHNQKEDSASEEESKFVKIN